MVKPTADLSSDSSEAQRWVYTDSRKMRVGKGHWIGHFGYKSVSTWGTKRKHWHVYS